MIKFSDLMRRTMYVMVLLVLTNIPALSEIFFTFSIVELSIRSDTIVEATFLKKAGDKYLFLIQGLNQNKKERDTLSIDNIDRLFTPKKENSFFPRVGFENSEKLIIYLSLDQENKFLPTWSGYRLLKHDKIYLPSQPINPGKFIFSQTRDSISWSELKENIINVNRRIKYIKALKASENNKNQKLIDWIKEQGPNLMLRGGLNENIGWGSYGWDVFKWITENNNAKDTWEASKLFRKIHYQSRTDWSGHTGILGDHGGNSFSSYKDIYFLTTIALGNSEPIIDRKQSLNYLSTAVRKVYENNYPIPDSVTLAFQINKQKELQDLIYPLIKDVSLKEYAFSVLRVLSNPMDGNLKHRIDLERLPDLIKLYKQEPPSDYKSNLAMFILHNSTEEEWQTLTTNDAKIFIDLYQVHIDTIRNTLSFGINSFYGKEIIDHIPIIYIVSSSNSQYCLKLNYEDFKLPYQPWEGVRYMNVDISDLDKGKYKVYVSGKAGDKSQYNWKSEYGEFELN